MTMLADIQPSGGVLGARVTGLDLSEPLSTETVAALRQALLEHCVLVFPQQRLPDEEQVRFTGYFGPPQEHVRKQRPREVKEIFIISNVKENGESIGALGSGTVDFHSDLSYMTHPGTISLLQAMEIPQQGGQTQFCDCRAAYDALPEDRRQYLSTLRAVHRHYVEEQNPGGIVSHPVVRIHSETQRRSLYVSPHLTSYIEAMEDTQSEELLSELYRHMDQPAFVWTHEWQLGDLLMWDNRPTMHRRLGFPDEQRRVMKRTQVFGTEPVVGTAGLP